MTQTKYGHVYSSEMHLPWPRSLEYFPSCFDKPLSVGLQVLFALSEGAECDTSHPAGPTSHEPGFRVGEKGSQPCGKCSYALQSAIFVKVFEQKKNLKTFKEATGLTLL